MPAREYDCKVTELIWLTPTCFTLRFEPSKSFAYEPGQFLSVMLPNGDPEVRTVRRIYSFASSGKKSGYELCVQRVQGGLGSNYLASLKPGDTIRISAPFGDFFYETHPHRNVCMIATSTGIAPFKAMVLSEHFKKNKPAAAMMLLGVRNEKEILFPGLFEKHGVEELHAVSQPLGPWDGFKGRVTDYLKALPESWPWQETDFYICGNGHMIEEVVHYLIKVRGVPKNAVRQEAYFSTHAVGSKNAPIEKPLAPVVPIAQPPNPRPWSLRRPFQRPQKPRLQSRQRQPGRQHQRLPRLRPQLRLRFSELPSRLRRLRQPTQHPSAAHLSCLRRLRQPYGLQPLQRAFRRVRQPSRRLRLQSRILLFAKRSRNPDRQFIGTCSRRWCALQSVVRFTNAFSPPACLGRT